MRLLRNYVNRVLGIRDHEWIYASPYEERSYILSLDQESRKTECLRASMSTESFPVIGWMFASSVISPRTEIIRLLALHERFEALEWLYALPDT